MSCREIYGPKNIECYERSAHRNISCGLALFLSLNFKLLSYLQKKRKIKVFNTRFKIFLVLARLTMNHN
jgi:uncharacterized protein YjhX (UPF0386 family)